MYMYVGKLTYISCITSKYMYVRYVGTGEIITLMYLYITCTPPLKVQHVHTLHTHVNVMQVGTYVSIKPGSQYDARRCDALRSKRKDRINFYLALRSLRATQRSILRHIVNQA